MCLPIALEVGHVYVRCIDVTCMYVCVTLIYIHVACMYMSHACTCHMHVHVSLLHLYRVYSLQGSGWISEDRAGKQECRGTY